MLAQGGAGSTHALAHGGANSGSRPCTGTGRSKRPFLAHVVAQGRADGGSSPMLAQGGASGSSPMHWRRAERTSSPHPVCWHGAGPVADHHPCVGTGRSKWQDPRCIDAEQGDGSKQQIAGGTWHDRTEGATCSTWQKAVVTRMACNMEVGNNGTAGGSETRRAQYFGSFWLKGKQRTCLNIVSDMHCPFPGSPRPRIEGDHPSLA